MAEDVNGLQVLVLTLVLIGLILGVGLLVLAKFGDAVAESTAVTDETVTITAGAGQFANVDQGITSVTALIFNASDAGSNSTITSANYTIGGVVALGAGVTGGWNFSYVYDKNVTATNTVSNTINALSPIASDWMPLIVTVAVLAIILGLVLSSFAVRTR